MSIEKLLMNYLPLFLSGGLLCVIYLQLEITLKEYKKKRVAMRVRD